MPITHDELDHLLRGSFPTAQITITDLAGDDDHWSVTIIDAKFEGKSRIEQHRMVQAATMNHDIHALQIKTETP